MKKLIQLVAIVFTSLISSLAFGQVDFIMIPPKTVEPGQNAIMILPVKVLDSQCRYAITKAPSNKDFVVEGPDSVEGKSQEVQYLPFNVFIPSFAQAGSVFFLKLTLTPQQGCSSQQIFEKELSVKIGSLANAAIDASADQIQLNSPAGKFDFAIRNSGNSNLNLTLSVENLTPNVRIQVTPSQMQLGPQQRKMAVVLLDFSGSGADFASFKVIARNGGQTFLSKNFQVRVLRGASTSSTVRTLQTNFFLTHDFFSEAGRTRQQVGAGGSVNGDLSDFYALSAYMQQFYLEDSNYNNYEVNLNNINGHQLTIGSALNPTGSHNVSARQLRGIRYKHAILKDVGIGFFTGADQNDNTHIGGYTEWTRGYNKRWMVFTDINATSGHVGGGITGQEHFQATESIAIAPSMTLTEDELRGTYKNFSTAFMTLISKKAPLQVRVVSESDKRYSQNGATATIDIPLSKMMLSLGAQGYAIKRQNPGVTDVTEGSYKEASFRVLFPFFYNSNGQISFRYQTRPAYTNGPKESTFAPEIYLSKSTDKWMFWTRVGRQAVNGYVDPALTGGTTPQETSGAENYAQFESQYKLNANTSVVYSAAYIQREVGDQTTFQNRVGVMREGPWKQSVSVRQTNERYNGQSTRTTGLEYQLEKKITPTLTYQVGATIERTSGYPQTDYTIYNRLNWTPGYKVPAKVENFFGGKNSGNVRGMVCFDINGNGICEPTDTPVGDNVIRIGSIDAVTDARGNYAFEAVAPGMYLLTLDGSKIPFAVTDKDLSREVDVRRNGDLTINFPLRWSGQLKVLVFDDKNGDKIWQPESENQLPDFSVAVFDAQGKEISQAKTTSTQYVSFPNLKQGAYTVKIVETVQGFEPSAKDGVTVQMPDVNNGLVQLGAVFKGDDSLLNKVVVDIVDKVIFEPEYLVEFLIEDPAQSVALVEIACGDVTAFSQKYTVDQRLPQQKISVNMVACKSQIKDGLLKLNLKLSDDQNKKSERLFDVLVQ